ncbi:hypothetical protein Tcan_00085 [Toxocara canis]|uniref:Uncharacterized protein n=1 Tax=Toxocara canis TaxID=6265 RepID=A0A0B2VU57_TOXCA|nr:hypothetical protein Tcan_00085 [Toxocara canis]
MRVGTLLSIFSYVQTALAYSLNIALIYLLVTVDHTYFHKYRLILFHMAVLNLFFSSVLVFLQQAIHAPITTHAMVVNTEGPLYQIFGTTHAGRIALSIFFSEYTDKQNGFLRECDCTNGTTYPLRHAFYWQQFRSQMEHSYRFLHFGDPRVWRFCICTVWNSYGTQISQRKEGAFPTGNASDASYFNERPLLTNGAADAVLRTNNHPCYRYLLLGSSNFHGSFADYILRTQFNR